MNIKGKKDAVSQAVKRYREAKHGGYTENKVLNYLVTRLTVEQFAEYVKLTTGDKA